MSQDFELRKIVRGAGGKYRVIKNNLAEKASEGTPSGQVLEGSARHDVAGLYRGRSGGAGEGADGVCEDQPDVHVQSGDGRRPCDRHQDDQRLATMPSKEEIFAKLLFLINAPAQRLVTAMNAVGRNLAVVVDQGVKENKFKVVRAGHGRLVQRSFNFRRSLEFSNGGH